MFTGQIFSNLVGKGPHRQILSNLVGEGTHLIGGRTNLDKFLIIIYIYIYIYIYIFFCNVNFNKVFIVG
jgi:hypothetical protein